MMNTAAPTPVVTRDAALAAQLGLPFVDEVRADQLELAPTAAGLMLRGRLGSGEASLVLDFGRGALRRRLLDAPSAPVVRALGKAARGHGGDATPGQQRDPRTRARGAERGPALERHPGVAALAADALERLRDDERLRAAASRVTLEVDDARTLLNALPAPVDGVVVDPMFETTTRGAPKKELQLLQRLLHGGEADDPSALLTIARERASVVVVKRAARAVPLAADVHHEVAGKGYRWDVYRQG